MNYRLTLTKALRKLTHAGPDSARKTKYTGVLSLCESDNQKDSARKTNTQVFSIHASLCSTLCPIFVLTYFNVQFCLVFG
jgi:hypothetical protein